MDNPLDYWLGHVGHYVLDNADATFADYKSGDPNKRGTYEHKKGKDFYTIKGEPGKNAVGFTGPAAIDSDGTGEGTDSTHQSSTSVKWDGKSLDASETPYVVVPTNDNVHFTTGNPFYDQGVRGGDLVRVTNPANGQTTYGVVGDFGPSGEVGEISQRVATDLGIDPDPNKGGFTEISKKNPGLQYEFYPGSAVRKENGSLKPLTYDEIQTAGRAVSSARSTRGGFRILTGNNTVLVGKEFQPVACADPRSYHVGGCPLTTGSIWVSVEGRPVSRVGDLCQCGRAVVSGEQSVQVFGDRTSQSAPLVNMLAIPDINKPWSDSPEPSWAKSALDVPTAPPLPTAQDLAAHHWGAFPTDWPSR
jgi:uncharacterized Zn-binding protein involved in type VI secretion